MLAMTLLLLDFVAIPILAIALILLLALYYRRWSTWSARERGARVVGSATREV